MRRPSPLVALTAILLAVASFGALRPAISHAAPGPVSCAADSGSATISGTVTGDGAAPLANTLVSAYTAYGQRGGYAYTSAIGVYTIPNLIAGSYLLKFEPGSGIYAPEWYNNQPSALTATPVAVASGATVVGINAQLAAGAQFSGQVTGEGVGALDNVPVTVYNSEGSQVASGYSNAAGSYTTRPGLMNGSYRIEFGDSGAFNGEYYSDKPSLEAATALVVSAPTVQSGINATLARGGSIGGKVVSAATGLPIVGAQVSANGPGDSGYDYTDASGNYLIDGLASGSYSVNVETPSGQNLISIEQTAAVTAPGATAGVNFTMSVGGTITGRVTDGAGAPLKDITIFYRNESGSVQDYIYTNASGVYTATALPSGSYEVLFRPSAYIPEAYNDQPDFNNATRIPLVAPATVRNIDASLAKGASVSGRVTDAATGDPIAGVFVEVLDSTGGRTATATTQADGKYLTDSELPSGRYTVRFNADDRNRSCAYVTEYYNGRTSGAAADALNLTAPNIAANIDATMDRGSIIFGKVTDAVTGAPITSGRVTIFDGAGKSISSGRISFTGGYQTDAIASGSYRVFFGDDTQGYIDEYYNDKPTLALATPLVIAAPTDRVGIDAALAKGGAISGTVTDVAGAPFAAGYIEVYDAAGSFMTYGSISNDGTYIVTSGLPTGSYRVAAVPYSQSMVGASAVETAQLGYATTFAPSTLIAASATLVSVTAPATTPNIAIRMQRGVYLPAIGR